MQRGIVVLILRVKVGSLANQKFDDFLVTIGRRQMQRSSLVHPHRIHIRTLAEKQLNDLFVINERSHMQRRLPLNVFGIHISTPIQIFSYSLNILPFYRKMNRPGRQLGQLATPHQKRQRNNKNNT